MKQPSSPLTWLIPAAIVTIGAVLVCVWLVWPSVAHAFAAIVGVPVVWGTCR